ncbi:MAG: hypothetical protein H7833_14020 [Magnetococcus sp. DMHC-1]
MLEISLTPELEQQLASQAKDSGRDLAGFILSIIKDYVEDQTNVKQRKLDSSDEIRQRALAAQAGFPKRDQEKLDEEFAAIRKEWDRHL